MPQGPRNSRVTEFLFPAGVIAALLAFGLFFDHSAGIGARGSDANAATVHAQLALEGSSPQVHRIASWIIATNDHGDLPFVVIDKSHAKLFAFNGSGRLLGSTLVTMDRGHGMPSASASAPAGRFVADNWHSGGAGRIGWANSAAVFYVHGTASAASAQPMQSEASPHHAIAGASLQVPEDFYRRYLEPLGHQGSVAYVLPGALPSQPDSNSYVEADPPRDGERLVLATLARSSS